MESVNGFIGLILIWGILYALYVLSVKEIPERD